jgi:hypothetical protein
VPLFVLFIIILGQSHGPVNNCRAFWQVNLLTKLWLRLFYSPIQSQQTHPLVVLAKSTEEPRQNPSRMLEQGRKLKHGSADPEFQISTTVVLEDTLSTVPFNTKSNSEPIDWISTKGTPSH